MNRKRGRKSPFNFKGFEMLIQNPHFKRNATLKLVFRKIISKKISLHFKRTTYLSTMEYKENNTMLEHIRRPESINPALADAFQAVVKLAMTNPGIAMRIVFRKSDGSIRTMDVAFDEHMKDSFSANLTQAQENGNAMRKATNSSRRNLVVRERIKENGEYRFQWRTIPLERIMSVSPCL